MDFSREREREIELTSLIEIQNLICNITFFLLSFNFFFPSFELELFFELFFRVPVVQQIRENISSCSKEKGFSVLPR